LKEVTAPQLHLMAAKYYRELRLDKSKWQTIYDIDSPMREFFHLVQAKDFDVAFDVLDEIDGDFLLTWGFYDSLINMRNQLVGKLVDQIKENENRGRIGLCYYLKGYFKKSIGVLEGVIPLAREANGLTSLIVWLSTAGKAYRNLAQPEKSNPLFQEALTISRKINDQRMIAEQLDNLGNLERSLVNYTESIVFYNQALFIAKELNDQRSIGNYLSNLGIAYLDIGALEESITFFLESLIPTRSVGDRRREVITLTNLSHVYIDLGEYKKATRVAEDGLKISCDIGYSIGEVYAFGAIGRCNVIMEKYYDALNALDRGYLIASKLEATRELNRILTIRAQLMLAMESISCAEKNISDAILYESAQDNHYTYLIDGIISIMSNQKNKALNAFEKGLLESNQLIERSDEYYRALYTTLLCKVGLYLLQIDKTSTLYNDVIDTSKKCIYLCQGRGISKNTYNLLKKLLSKYSDDKLLKYLILLFEVRRAK